MQTSAEWARLEGGAHGGAFAEFEANLDNAKERLALRAGCVALVLTYGLFPYNP